MTIREKLGRLSGARLAYLGDGNNVCVSLMTQTCQIVLLGDVESRARTP